MKTFVRCVITLLYAISWICIFPVMFFIVSCIALCLWCYRDEERSYCTILKEMISEGLIPSPKDMWD